MQDLRSLLLWLVWCALSLIWLSTLWTHWAAGDVKSVGLAGIVVGLLFILYFAEGMELAVTDLLDKDPTQIRDIRIRVILEDIQQRSGFFFAQRQVFVVTIISFVSLVTSYEYIYIPGLGKVSEYVIAHALLTERAAWG